ncbi:MAG: insulinase family protein [Chloroflexi bacterium]|nr:insulinase family protein [Chloroflexota bacterium]
MVVINEAVPTYEKTSLSNGLRVVTSSMPHTRAVTVSIFVGAGSRYESPPEAGISHFVEHLCFKGTHRRASAKEISEAVERVGGHLNGGTDRELTVYWCKVARPYFSVATDVLVDMLRNSRFDPLEMEKERKVVLEELSAVWDSPAQRADVLIDEVLWPDQPLGRDVAGTKETVRGITQPKIIDYVGRHYLPNNAVVAVAGDISHEEIVDAFDRAMGDWYAGPSVDWHPVIDGQQAPRCSIETRRTEQTHLSLAVRGVPRLHPHRFVLDIINIILGEGMSSRLFVELREKRGLAYDIHSYVSHFRDAGALTIYAGVEHKSVSDVIQAMLEELDRFKEGTSEEELDKAKEMSKGRMMLRMEDTRSVATWLGAQEILSGRIYTVDDLAAFLDAVTLEDVKQTARQFFVTERLNLAVVGPFRSERRFLNLLKL